MSFVSVSLVDIKLVHGDSYREGRVEIFYNGIWGTVCDNGWDLNDAHVVCRSLGFSAALNASFGGVFRHGSGRIFLDDVSCSGTELSIFYCPSKGIGIP